MSNKATKQPESKEKAMTPSEALDYGDEVLAQLKSISMIQYNAIRLSLIERAPVPYICAQLGLTPDRIHIEMAAGFRALFHLSIDDKPGLYFVSRAASHAAEQQKPGEKEPDAPEQPAKGKKS